MTPCFSLSLSLIISISYNFTAMNEKTKIYVVAALGLFLFAISLFIDTSRFLSSFFLFSAIPFLTSILTKRERTVIIKQSLKMNLLYFGIYFLIAASLSFAFNLGNPITKGLAIIFVILLFWPITKIKSFYA